MRSNDLPAGDRLSIVAQSANNYYAGGVISRRWVMFLYCPHCGRRIPGRPGQYVRCWSCTSHIYWAGGKPCRSADEAAERALLLATEAELAARRRRDREAAEAESRAVRMRARAALAEERRAARIRRSQERQSRLQRHLRRLRVHWQQCTAPGRALFAAFAPGLPRSLDVYAAKRLIESLAEPGRPLRLDRVNALGSRAAAALAGHKGDLSLNALSRLPPAVAQALARHRGTLSLQGLTTIGIDAADALIHHLGSLDLSGLEPMNPRLALTLNKYRGALIISVENRCLMASAAAWHARAANPASTKKTERHWWDTVTSLTPDLAKTLARVRGPLNLRMLRLLTPEVAGILATHDGDLHFPAIQEMSTDAAFAFSRHSFDLTLNGLKTLSPATAQALATHRGPLQLAGLADLGEDIAAALATHREWLSMDGLRSLQERAVRFLVRHEGDMQLDGISTLTPEVGTVLARYRHWLSLKGVKSLDLETARALARYRGSMLWLTGLHRLERDAVDALRANPSILIPKRYRVPGSP